MAIYAVPLKCPGAESALTPWVQRTGSGFGRTSGAAGVSPRTGNYCFFAGTSATNKWDQQVQLETGLLSTIDATGVVATAKGWRARQSGDTGTCQMYIEARDASLALLASDTSAATSTAAWTEITLTLAIPTGTRYLRIGTNNVKQSGNLNNDSYWDDFSIDLEGDFDTDLINVKALQLSVYALGQQPAAEANSLQLGTYSLGAAETSNTFHDVNVFQLGAYALVKGLVDRRDLRAWTFTQDDHDFYVLQLGDESTFVFDKLTKQWSKWISPDFVYWRGQDGCAWEGYNLTCDTESGVIWEIDPEGRLDYGTDPIRSQVTGQLTERFRNHVNCYMAELAVSEAQPPASIDASTVGITLRTYDSNGLNSVDHGEVPGEAIGDDITVRWYGLGLMQAPGRVFEITDTGYARRVEGLNLEVGGQRDG